MFRSRSADAVDLVVNKTGIRTEARLTPWNKDRPAAGGAVAMLAFAAGLIVAAVGARAADEPARPRPTAERASTDSVRVQPTAKQFTPPNQPEIHASDGSRRATQLRSGFGEALLLRDGDEDRQGVESVLHTVA
jgi:hypothetical protein